MRAISVLTAGQSGPPPLDRIELDAQARHLRRKLLSSQGGLDILVDFDRPVRLGHGDRLVLEDGRAIGVVAANEDLCEVRGIDAGHLSRLAWHIGNRHLEAQIETDRILIRRDPVIARMLEGLGAALAAVSESFSPEHGAYHGHAHGP